MPLTEAEKKFWRTPELVDRLMTFLGGQSTLALVKALPLALDIIGGKSSWIKLVRRVCPYDTPDTPCVSVAEWEEIVAEERKDVVTLVEILKMMELEDSNSLLLDLLHVICKNFPLVDRDDVPVEARASRVNDIPGPELIQVSCSCEQASHALSPGGFLYLEEAERAMGTTVQKVERVVVDDLGEPWLADLQSRLLRQQDLGVDTDVDVSRLFCNSSESAEAISTLMQLCQRVDVQDAIFTIKVDIGTEGWAALGKALSWKSVGWIESDKVHMASARKEDLKAIWEGVTSGWEVFLDDDRSELFEDWDEFERFLKAEEDVKEKDEDNAGQI